MIGRRRQIPHHLLHRFSIVFAVCSRLRLVLCRCLFPKNSHIPRQESVGVCVCPPQPLVPQNEQTNERSIRMEKPSSSQEQIRKAADREPQIAAHACTDHEDPCIFVSFFVGIINCRRGRGRAWRRGRRRRRRRQRQRNGANEELLSRMGAGFCSSSFLPSICLSSPFLVETNICLVFSVWSFVDTSRTRTCRCCCCCC